MNGTISKADHSLSRAIITVFIVGSCLFVSWLVFNAWAQSVTDEKAAAVARDLSMHRQRNVELSRRADSVSVRQNMIIRKLDSISTVLAYMRRHGSNVPHNMIISSDSCVQVKIYGGHQTDRHHTTDRNK